MEVELTIIDNHSAQTRVVLRGLPAILGRAESADVPLRDPWASHAHCELSERNGVLVVRDLGSKNGIFLHGNRITESSLLPGDCFTIGRTKIVVHYREEPQTAAQSQAAESGAQPGRGTLAATDPDTRDLLYGDAGEAAKPSIPPKDE